MYKIIILSFKESKRLAKIKKRFKYLNLNFKVIYGVNAKTNTGQQILKKNYNKERSEFFLGRPLPYAEMSAPYLHLKAYKYIVKNKINNCIILEDDVYPSKELVFFKNNVKIKKDNYIIGLMSYDGFIFKKPDIKLKKFNIHTAKTHLHHVAAYACDLLFCKTMLSKTKGKICGVSDWPINLIKNNIYSSVVLPYPVIIDETNESLLANDRKLSLPSYKIKKFIPKNLFSFLSFFYYLCHIPYFTGRYKSLKFFREYFIEKKICLFINYFFDIYINTKNIYYDKNFYSMDLISVIKKNIKKKLD